MSELAKTIELLQVRRNQGGSPESARFTLTLTRLLAEGKPVSASQLTTELDDPVEFVTISLNQMQQSGAEFNDKGELIGSALTLTPTRHHFEVSGVKLYAWCALDTMFLPAYIGKTAYVTSTCPVTNTPISLIISPNSIETFSPSETVVSIMTAEGCSAGIEGTFCNQVNFFASVDVAREWIVDRTDFTILTVPEAYQLATQIYIEPVMKHS